MDTEIIFSLWFNTLPFTALHLFLATSALPFASRGRGSRHLYRHPYHLLHCSTAARPPPLLRGAWASGEAHILHRHKTS